MTLGGPRRLTLLVLMLANDTDLFVNPWNPWVAVLPFFTYVLLAWSLADGDVAVLPWLVGVGTLHRPGPRGLRAARARRRRDRRR